MPSPSEPAAAAPEPAAALSIEPPLLAIGDVATLELVVATPPEHRVLPLVPPDPADLPGLWLLDVETLPAETGPVRWVHRARLRVRPRDVGVHAWPALAVEVEDPEGGRRRLEIPARTIEVVSVLPDHAGRTGPFGLLEPAEGGGPLRRLAWAAGGAAFGLLAAGALALARRRRPRSRSEAGGPTAPPEPGPGLAADAERARAELAGAQELAASDPRAAADAGARALRRWATVRFGRDLGASTTEELAQRDPPVAARAAWPALLRLLGALDAVRFAAAPRAAPESDDERARLRVALELAQRFVAGTGARGGRGA
jgi:hypothetical protein